MLDEEDARGTGPSGIQFLRESLLAPDAELQRVAVRAIGRFEDSEFVPLTFPLLFSGDEAVRAEAINALGQASSETLGDEVADLLFDYLAREEQEGPAVRAAIARTLGRLRYADAARFRRAEETLLGMTRDGDGDAPLVTVLGAALGLESMARGRGRGVMSEASVERLRELASLGRAEDGAVGPDSARAESESVSNPMRLGDPARIRRVAMLALSTIGTAGSDAISGAIRDADPDVRRLAVTMLGRGPAIEGTGELLIEAFSDPSPRVRVEAVRTYAARAPEPRECAPLFSLARDDDLNVALAALDLLGQPCGARPQQDALLSGLAAGLENAGPMDWHRGAHALVSLATVSPADAGVMVDGAIRSANPFVRMYAARAAASMGSTEVLKALAADPSPNVRTVAVQGLFGLVGRSADDLLVAQLEQDDPQLLLVVAGLLEGTTNVGETLGPLLAAFARISQEQRETARDPRMELLARISEMGGRAQVAELEPYLTDYDPVVASRAAEILTGWGGAPRVADPTALQRQPLPSAEGVARLANTHVVLEMARGGEIEIRLLSAEAPLQATRFELLAGSGYFDGLTFHRVVPNFVLQGGSPGANEYVGVAAFARDELGLVSHWRGTVGASTRGRDTGDGQFFINLVDNLRLDHAYTVFGEVVAGMDVADSVAEGDVIVRARVVVDGEVLTTSPTGF